MSPTVFFGLTSLGVIHTLISLIAVTTGAIELLRDGEISGRNYLGKVYIRATIIVCLTGFLIFQHGGFGKPHILGIITLLTLGVVYLASSKKFGNFSPYVETVGYSLTYFFHIVAAITELATRLPLHAPFASDPDDSRIQLAIGVCFVLFLLGAFWQVKKMQPEK